jgi:aryl-alcohol dehydrogenase-like predicted oxidoreductase
MNKINIPKTELCASTLTHGTEYFGSTVSRDVCMELTDHDLKAGGNVIDICESRVHWLPGGEHQSEKVIGEWLRERGTRNQIILSTKGTDRAWMIGEATDG